MIDDEIKALKLLRRRQRDAAEQLMTNSRLRDNLTDVQAEMLLDWALAFVNQRANQTVAMPDEAAERFMEEMVTAVSRCLRQFNQLVPQLPRLDDETAAILVQQLLSNWRDLTGADPILIQFDLLAPERQTWDNEAVFQRLILITQETPWATARHEEHKQDAD